MSDERAITATQPQQVGLDLPTRKVIDTTQVGEAERIEQTVVIPPIYMYPMKRWQQPDKISLTSEAYAYINRVLGVQFHKPDEVVDSEGKRVGNPIHRPGYIYLRLVGIWRNDMGQLTSYSEDVEVDYQLVYQDARINARSAKVLTDAQGNVVFENGLPKIALSAEDELKAYKALSQLRTFGLRYVQTVAATRILKRATGISSLPIDRVQPFPIRVVAFRDRLSPEERIKQAGQDMQAMFGAGQAVDPNNGLTDDEMADIREVEPTDMAEEVEIEAVAAHVIEQDERHSFDATEPARNVTPNDVDPDGLFENKPQRPAR